jgi:uncharacterized protein
LIGILALSCLSAVVFNNVIAQSTAPQSTTAKELSITLLDKVKSHLPNASIVVGIISTNGTQVYGYGSISKANSTKVNGNTISRISIIGHSQGTIIAPRVAIDNSTKVKNIVLMGIVASSIRDLIYLQRVSLPLEYVEKVLDKNHTGLISIQQISKNPMLRLLLIPSSIALTFLRTNDTNVIKDSLEKIFANKTNVAGYISIEHQIKPLLIKRYENLSSFSSSKCNMVEYCSVYYRALFSLLPNLSIIGNISKSTGILLLNGENDSLTPVEQAFLLQQKLTEVNHPDHILITYPNLGHLFYSSSRWMTTYGPIQQYVIADIYSWLEAHSGLSDSFFKPTNAFTNTANTSSLNTNKTS